MPSKPIYNAYIEDSNRRCFKAFNVFNHYSFVKGVQELIEQFKDREEFEYKLEKEVMYCFWAKCEYEIIVMEWPPSKENIHKKVDVYDQIKLNWPIFADYVWNHRDEIEALDYE